MLPNGPLQVAGSQRSLEASKAVNYRRIGNADTSGDWDEAMPPVGGHIKVKAHSEGYRFSVNARIDMTVISLIDVVETENTWTATVAVALEFEISDDQWRNCETFWLDRFLPNAVKVFFKDAEERANIFSWDDETRANATVGKDELGSPMVDAAGRFARLFRLRRRVTATFRQAMDLVNYPYDAQCLVLAVETEGELIFGKYYKIDLHHPLPCAGSMGWHKVMENADCVDDLKIETLFALSGAELAAPLERPRLSEYAVLLFVSRQYKSTMWNAILPTFMIEVLSLMTYWVEPCELADRGSVTLTLFLTAVSFKSYMSDRLPAVPYLTAVEVYLFQVMAVLLVQGVLLIFAAIDVELRIARDWYLGDPAEPAKKGYKFRTTWSSGWYLDYIVRKKTALLGLEGTGFKNLI